MEDQKQIRCAIYTRKSTDEGLEKEFNTLEAQREAGENFVMSMKHQGWVILPLLVNFARGGTLNQLGNVQNDQMQGHWHEMVYRQDSTSSGYRSDIFGCNV